MPNVQEIRRPSIWLAIPVMLVLIAVWTNSEFPLDYWLHVNNGRWMVEHYQWITTDSFSHTIDGQPVKNQPWLAQLMMFGLHTLGGYALNQFVAGLCYATAVIVTVGMAARRCGNWTLAALAGSLAFAVLSTNLGVRPQYFSVLLFVGQLYLLRYGRGLVVPVGCLVIVALWTNIHGAFPLGVVLPAIMLVAAWFDRPSGERSERLRRLWLALAGSAVGCFLRSYPQDTLGYVCNVGSCSLQRGLEEWLPTSMATPAGPAFFGSVLIVLAILASARRRAAFWELLLLTAFFCLAVTSQRMVMWWALALPVAIARSADHVWRRVAAWRGRQPRRQMAAHPFADRWISAGLAAFALGFLLFCTPWTRPFNRFLPPLKRYAVPYNEPLGVVQQFVDLPRTLRTFAPLPWGSYLSWHSDGQLKSFLDSRVDFFPDRVWNAFVEIRNGGPQAQALLNEFEIDVVICGPQEVGLARLLRSDLDWRLTHEDEVGCAFCRASGFLPQDAVMEPQ